MPNTLAVDALRRIDSVCDQFEEAWRSGSRPRIEDYLAAANPAERESLLDALQALQHELILGLPSSEPAQAQDIHFLEIPDDSDSRKTDYDSVIPEETWSSDDAEKRVRVVLRVVDGPHSGQEFVFTNHDTLLVGRISKAQLRLKDDLHFSRYHFRLEFKPPTCFLLDLSSRNGTFVNGTRVSECFLNDGDVISGGRTKMSVSIVKPRGQSSARQPEAIVPVPEGLKTPAAERQLRNTSNQDGAPFLPPKPAAPQISIPGFQIQHAIGRGDLGTVYQATQVATGLPCSLKVIFPSGDVSQVAIKMFLREAKLVSQLKHPHIVSFLEMGESRNHIFLATEFVETVRWEELVQRWSPQQRIRNSCGLMCQVLSALDYAHSCSFVHRDIKPANILITRQNGKLAAKVSDFGLAKQYTTAGMSQITRDGDVIGSLPFMSPDQFINSREARPACDIYSAGATLYWMLTGFEPIPLENHPCKFLAILEDSPTPITRHNPALPPALADLVHRALDKSPEKRFASADEMRQQLRQFCR